MGLGGGTGETKVAQDWAAVLSGEALVARDTEGRGRSRQPRAECQEYRVA